MSVDHSGSRASTGAGDCTWRRRVDQQNIDGRESITTKMKASILTSDNNTRQVKRMMNLNEKKRNGTTGYNIYSCMISGLGFKCDCHHPASNFECHGCAVVHTCKKRKLKGQLYKGSINLCKGWDWCKCDLQNANLCHSECADLRGGVWGISLVFAKLAKQPHSDLNHAPHVPADTVFFYITQVKDEKEQPALVTDLQVLHRPKCPHSTVEHSCHLPVFLHVPVPRVWVVRNVLALLAHIRECPSEHTPRHPYDDLRHATLDATCPRSRQLRANTARQTCPEQRCASSTRPSAPHNCGVAWPERLMFGEIGRYTKESIALAYFCNLCSSRDDAQQNPICCSSPANGDMWPLGRRDSVSLPWVVPGKHNNTHKYGVVVTLCASLHPTLYAHLPPQNPRAMIVHSHNSSILCSCVQHDQIVNHMNTVEPLYWEHFLIFLNNFVSNANVNSISKICVVRALLDTFLMGTCHINRGGGGTKTILKQKHNTNEATREKKNMMKGTSTPSERCNDIAPFSSYIETWKKRERGAEQITATGKRRLNIKERIGTDNDDDHTRAENNKSYKRKGTEKDRQYDIVKKIMPMTRKEDDSRKERDRETSISTNE
ncbi:hypothetical protein VP01_1417g1 [Puccinia sorghi]|uniref:Uncharacterized protein n=1 Tax=Puccinia sorghi TaxID=27349 RepID=A0A0L6VKX9_9BASI|nr:hypothetical protein VP01_1417g1 [Puccinia sorghi]